MTSKQPRATRAQLVRLALGAALAASADDAEIEARLGRAVAELDAIVHAGSPALALAAEQARFAAAIRAWSAPLSECITYFEAISVCGKTFELLPDGSVKKSSELNAGIMNAKIVHVPDADALAAVLRGAMTKPNAGVVLHAVRGLRAGDNFVIYPMSGLAQFLGVPVDASGGVAEADRPKLVGIHLLSGIRVIARMKENFAPSIWALLDRDVDEFTPSQFDGTNLPFDAWLALLDDKLMPGLAACERVVVPSSSARVARVDGPDAGNPVGAGNGHVFVRLTGDLARLPAIASQITAKAQLAGIAWLKPRLSKIARQKIGESPATIIDQTVMNLGRLVFDGLPHLIDKGLMHLPTEVQVHHGPAYDLAAFADISDADIAAFNANGSTKLTRNKSGGVSRHDYSTLRLDTPLDPLKMTVAEWEASGRPRTRIQAPFRASSSMAAFIDRNPLRVYDSGTDTTYYLANPDPATTFSPIPPPSQVAAPPGEPPRPEPFPGSMTEIVKAMMGSSAKPREALAIYAALGGMASACHGRIRFAGDRGMRLNLYMTILLGTGEGKEGALQVAEAVARAAGAQVTGKPASGSALEGLLTNWEPLLVQIDEAGHLLAAMNAKNASGFLVDLAAVLLQLYSRSNGIYYTRSKAGGSEEEKLGRAVRHPAVSAMMFATPEKYAQAVGTINVAGGDLGRHLYFIDPTPVRQRRVSADFALPPTVRDCARQIAATNTFSVIEPGKPPQSADIDMDHELAIAYAPGVEGVLQETMDRFSDRQVAPAVSPLERMLAARGYENTLRVAGVLAVWDNPSAPVLRADHVTWAEALVSRSVFDVVRFMDEHLHESQVLADAARVKGVCQRLLAGELKLKKSSLSEQDCLANGLVPRGAAIWQSRLDPVQFGKAIGYLQAVGDVEERTFQRPGGKLIAAIELLTP